MIAVLAVAVAANLVLSGWLWRSERRRRRRRPRQLRTLGDHARLVSVPHRERHGA